MKWYKFDPDAWLAGTVELTPEERGIYITVLNLMYSRDGNIPQDDQFFARACNCDPRMWRRIRDALLAKGKLQRGPDGTLNQTRVLVELEDGRKRIDRMRALRQIQLQYQQLVLAGAPGQPQPQSKKERGFARKGPGWTLSGYSNGRSLGNGQASSIEDTLKDKQ